MTNNQANTSGTPNSGTPSQIDRVTNQQGSGGAWWPSDTPGPRTPLPSTAPTARPTDATLELLITVRLLREEVKRGTIQPEPQARVALRNILVRLSQAEKLGPAQAASTQQVVMAELNAQQFMTLQQRRADLERSVQNLMARARFATPDGPADLTRIRYSFMVPDGNNVMKALAQQPTLNPYRMLGANSALLKELLELLRVNAP